MDPDLTTPEFLVTPSLLTPNISVTPLLYKSSQTDSIPTDNDNTQTESTSNPSSIMTIITTTNDESLSVSSAEIKLSKIENELKQSFSQPRKPTESPFQRIVEAGVLPYEKNTTLLPPTMSDSIPANVPSTADVVNDIESFSKAATSKEVNERETTTSDTSPSQAMGVIVSPKKKLLFRSQSHTDPASPTSIMANNLSQLQKSLRDEDNSTDEEHNHQSQRFQDLPILTHPVDSSAQVDNNYETTYTIQVRTNPNGAQQTITKQQQATVLSNKRSFASTIIASPVTKPSSVLLSQPTVINEVSSSDQSLGSKRQKTSSTTSRTSYTQPTTDDDNNSNNGNSDDQRKKQIRDSNREAARRCRERRRNYIEQLEGNLEQYKTQIKQLTENLARAERENTQLRAIISETKLFPSTARITVNDSMMDFSSNGIDITSETTDGNAIQRSFVTRNTR